MIAFEACVCVNRFSDGQEKLQTMAGNGSQRNKQPDCILEERYLRIVGCLCVNYAGNMSLLLMVKDKRATLDTVPMKKAKIVRNAYLEQDAQSLTVLRNTTCQSELHMFQHLLLVLKSG